MLGAVLSDGAIIVKKITYLKIFDYVSFIPFFFFHSTRLNTTFEACSCSHSNNSDEPKQNKKWAGVGN